jgi:hypothetical protein
MSILKRTVLYDETGGYFRFWDWAYVDTTIGPMGEPFLPGSRYSLQTPTPEFDPTDEIAMVNCVVSKPIDLSLGYFSSGGQAIGGYTMPRDGK